MLNVISVSENFFKCVNSCGRSKKGMRIDHSAVRLDFMNRSIKYNTTFIEKPVIDWKDLKEKDDVNLKINVNLRNRLQEPFNYTEFNESILRSGEDTAMIDNSENQGWFHFSRKPSHPPLMPENQCSVTSYPITIPHPQQHFSTWKHSNTRSTKQWTQQKQGGLVTLLNKSTTFPLIPKLLGWASDGWQDASRVITLLRN